MNKATLIISAFWALAVSAASALSVPLASQTDFFVQNEGQWEGAFAFKYSGNGATCFLTATGMTLDLHQYDKPPRRHDPLDRMRHEEEREPVTVRGHVLRLSYINANTNPQLIGEDKLSSYSNYFLGRDSCKWRSRVGHYRGVIAKDVWPGIDVQYRIAAQGVEAAYHVHPFADPAMIQLRYEGQQGDLSVASDGTLQIRTSLGVVKEQAPFAYQDINHVQTEIPCRYEPTKDGTYRMVIGSFDTTQELVIDPLVYSSFWESTDFDAVHEIAQDRDRHKIIAGETAAPANFPITPGAYCDSADYISSYLSKFTGGGDTLQFSTYIGYSDEQVNALAVDARNSIYVAGLIFSTGYGYMPLTQDAFDSVAVGPSEGFVSRISSDGTTMEFSSFAGGSDHDQVTSLAIDSSGSIYLGGWTTSSDVPTTPGALYPSLHDSHDGFLMRFDPTTSTLLYSTYFPGPTMVSQDLLDSGGRLWIYGDIEVTTLPVTADAFQGELHGSSDTYFAHLDLQTNTVMYCSYLGGTMPVQGRTEEWLTAVVRLGGDTLVLSGFTVTPDFPVTADACDTAHYGTNDKLFFTMLELPQNLVCSTLLGGGANAMGGGKAMDDHGAFVASATVPPGFSFPLTPDAFDTTWHNMVLCRMSHDLRHLEYGTYLANGTPRSNILVEHGSTIWLAGDTPSPDFPITPNAVQPQFYGTDTDHGFYLCFAMPDSSDATPTLRPVPEAFTLTAYPNPFNPTTTISFTLRRAEHVKLTVFDVLGREVFALPCAATNGVLNAGEHRVTFDGSRLASGVYFARLQTPQASRIQKLLLLR